MSFFKKICLFVVLVGSLSFHVWAEDNLQSSKQLIDAYLKAVRSNNDQLIKSTWAALNNDEQAKNYMHENMPALDYLFKIRGLYIELQEYQMSRPEFLGKSNNTGRFQETVNTLRQDLSGRSSIKVEKFSISAEDSNRLRTNRDIVLDSKNVPLLDNGTIALANPNQNRLDNRVLLDSRKERFHLSKFQQTPSELVPRGSTFPKAKPAIEADAIVNEIACRLFFENSSTVDQSIDIYINDALVGRKINVQPDGRWVDVYFSAGINWLRVVQYPSEDSSVLLGITLQGATYIDDKTDWVIQSGQDRQWLVEARI